MYLRLFKGESETNILLHLLFLVNQHRTPMMMKKIRTYLLKSDFAGLKKDLKKISKEAEKNYSAILPDIKKLDRDKLTDLLKIIEIVVAY